MYDIQQVLEPLKWSIWFCRKSILSTIDWDDVAKTNVSLSVYIHDDAKSGGAGYISWNGSGDVTNGLIAPFQGFVVTASGGAGYITIQLVKADKASSFRNVLSYTRWCK